MKERMFSIGSENTRFSGSVICFKHVNKKIALDTFRLPQLVHMPLRFNRCPSFFQDHEDRGDSAQADRARKWPPVERNSLFRVEENGVLYLAVGYVQTEQGAGFMDQAV